MSLVEEVVEKKMPDMSYELQYTGLLVAGVDEAGRGALAGPVVAAAVIIDNNDIVPGINDSKKLSPRRRQALYDMITSKYHYAVAMIGNDKIDEINILQASILACELAAGDLSPSPEIVLVDGNMKFADERFLSIISGDAVSISIAAASIVAKVTRDRIMIQYAQDYSVYNWHKNMGYGTKEHILAMAENGLSCYHRKSFIPKKLKMA